MADLENVLSTHTESRRIWRRVGVGALVTAALVAFATTFGQNMATRIFPPTVSTDGLMEGGFTVAVSFFYPVGQTLALPTPLRDGPDSATLRAGFPDPDRDLTSFLGLHGGAAVDQTLANIVFTGTGKLPTRIVSVRPIVRSRSAVLDGTKIVLPSQGNVKPTVASADLDEQVPIILADGAPFFARNEIDVAVDDRSAFSITFLGSKQTVRWVMGVDYVGKEGQAAEAYFGIDGLIADTPELVKQSAWFAVTGVAETYGVSFERNLSDNGFHPIPS